MINVNNLKPGTTFQDNGQIYVVLEATHSKQGRSQANVKVKVKNLRTKATIMTTYTGGTKVEKAHITTKDMDYLYNDSVNAFLMDQETFAQTEFPLDNIRWEKNFLKEGDPVKMKMFKSEVLDLELKPNVVLRVQEAPDAVRGNTTNNPQKKITLETGFELEAPMFIKPGEKVVVSTETGKYVGRSNDG